MKLLMRLIRRGSTPAPEQIENIASRFSLSRETAAILLQRDLGDEEAIRRYLDARLEDLSDPMLLPDMDAAVTRIRKAVEQDEAITLFGDYDVDGVCGTSILLEYLLSQHARVSYYIPSRHHEGYGVNMDAVSNLAAQGCRLMVTVDCGISNREEADLARRLGMDVIITDHHQCPRSFPDAVAIVNPHRADSQAPFRKLCGAGVALKLVWAMGGDEALLKGLDLAALATVADIVPLIEENRILVRHGLERINRAPRPGIAALIQAAGLNGKTLSVGHLGFQLGPRINAGGRVHLSAKSVAMLTASTWEEAFPIAEELEHDNEERKTICDHMVQEAVAMVPARTDIASDYALILWKDDWNSGVLGIVASKLVERYHRPVVLLAREGELLHGSGRSIPGINLFEMLNACRDLFVRFGGHEQAAGMVMEPSNALDFQRRFNSILGERIAGALYIPASQYDLNATVTDVSFRLVDELQRLEPFGFGNPAPRLCMSDVSVQCVRTMGTHGQHFRAEAVQADKRLPIVAFGMKAPKENAADSFDLILTPASNTWNGRVSLQGEVEALQRRNPSPQAWLERLPFLGTAWDRTFWTQALHDDALQENSAAIRLHDESKTDALLAQAMQRPFGTLILAPTAKSMAWICRHPDCIDAWPHLHIALSDMEPMERPENVLLVAPRFGEWDASLFRQVLVLGGVWQSGYLFALANWLGRGSVDVVCSEEDVTLLEHPALFTPEFLRSIFARIRKLLRAGTVWSSMEHAIRSLAESVNQSAWVCEVALGIFAEMGILLMCEKEPYVYLPEPSPTAELQQSGIYRNLQNPSQGFGRIYANLHETGHIWQE